MLSIRVAGLRLLATVFFCVTACFSQTESASISGTVVDAAGAMVPSAVVEAVSLETGAKRSTVSSSSGVYTLTALSVGHYRVTITIPGFQTYTRENVQLQVGQNLTLDANLQLTSVSTSVDVQDTVPPLDEVSATIGGVVSGEQVRQLPINGRSWASLMTQTPGAMDAGTDNQRSIRFAGHGLDDNNYRFDGVDATGILNQAQKGTFRLQFSTEAIAEFRANAAVYTAESGGTQGGQVDVVSRSGSNDFHGSAFEYLRNDAFDARGPFDRTLPPFRLNQFGGSFGGPIRKDKDFFFVTYEGLRQRVGQTLIGFVPSPGFRAQVAQTSPALSPILAAYPAGTAATSDPNVMRYIGAGRQLTNEDFGMFRYDHRFSDANTFAVRYNIDNGLSDLPNGSLRDRTATTLTTQNAAIVLDTVLSPRTVNEFKAGFNRPNFQTHNESVLDLEFITPQFSTLYNGTGKVQVANSFDYLDDLTSAHGKHTIKAGVEIRRVQLNATATSSNDYELSYARTADFQNNLLSQASLVNTLPTTGLRRTEYFGFVQDEFRVTPTLTANLGIRYEYFGVPYEVSGRGLVFDPLSCPGGYCPQGTSFYKPDYNNFSPRVSLAWAPAFSNRTAIRTGYGIYYGDGQIGDLTAPLDNLAGRALVAAKQVPGLSYPVDPSYATNAFAPSSPRSLDRNRATPYTEEWTLSVQQALTTKTVMTIGYLGESGAKQFTRTYLNTPDPVTHAVAYPQFGLIDYKTTASNNNFNALQVQLQRNLSGSLQTSVNYMWSHAINDGSTGGGETDYPQNVRCRACERASSDFDIRHYLSSNLIYQLPFGKGRRFLKGSGFASAILGGWEWANILTARSGLPLNVSIARTAAVLPDGNTSSPQRPNVVAGQSVIPGNQSITNFINIAAFSTPASGTFGDAGRNLLRGPDQWQLDSALVKDIPLTERLQLSFRAEAFNIFNHPQYGLPNANFSNPASFGQITTEANATGIGTGTPRNLEFALRLQF
ncbi:MAG: TonB-dependent receptor [Acidobacteriota bacterium]|nr:TonB-dependent receptor [Acidobacteriota bacterium]